MYGTIHFIVVVNKNQMKECYGLVFALFRMMGLLKESKSVFWNCETVNIKESKSHTIW